MHKEEKIMAKRVITFGEIMMRLNPESYLRFSQLNVSEDVEHPS